MVAVDGFRAESVHGLLGWVEEAWLGPDDEPDALALRLVDGRRALILAADVEAVVAEREQVAVRDGARMLELGPPHLDGAGRHLSASWETTGEVLDPPEPPGKFRQALLELRPWRLAPPPATGVELPVWQAVAILLPALALLIALEITLAFVIAYLVTGRAY